MRFRLTAAVEGVGVAPQRFEVDTPEYRVGFDVDEKRRITSIWAEARVLDWEKYLSSIEPGAGTREQPHRVSFQVPPVASALESVLQYLESLGSFWLGIRRVGWSEAEMRWMPDSQEEEGRLRVHRFSQRITYNDTPIPWDGKALARLVGLRPKLEYLVVPMSFYREGVREFRVHRYVSAFYNFYLFLEGLYGHGKTKNAQVQQAFESSAQFRAAVDATRIRFSDNEMARNQSELLVFMQRLNCEFTAQGLSRFLVMIRGELHHYSTKSTRPKGHPLNQAEWRPVALFAFSVCVHLVQQLANGAALDTR